MIYNLFAFFVWILALPFLILASLKPKYKKSLPARFFLRNNPPFSDAHVHFHACSLGEVNSISFLAKEFENVAISTTTQTGFEAANKISPNSRFLPFEIFLPFWLKKSKILVVFEAELWLNLFKYARKNGAFTILLNARISDKSYPRYKKFSFFYKKIFANIDLVLAQSQNDKIRLESLGAQNVEVWGNVKSANISVPNKNYKKFSQKLITIASIHDSEIAAILRALKPQKGKKYIFAPRHPEKFALMDEKISLWAKNHALSYEKFSQNLGFDSDIILLDTLGELVNFYQISDVVVLCGSFVDFIGGHNPIEIAQFRVPLISGKFIFNQISLFKMVENVKFCDINELENALNSDLKPSRIIQKFDSEKFIKLIKEKL